MIDPLRTITWRPVSEENVSALPGCVGVYEVADETGAVVDIGYAGGLLPFGLRSALTPWLSKPGTWQFAYEVTSSYLTRFRELAMLHRAIHGELPDLALSHADPIAGRLQPSS